MKISQLIGDPILTIPRSEQEKRGKIRTYTGKYVNPFEMRGQDLDIRDMAHALSVLKRYTGHTPVGHSVAQHSLWVSYQFDDRDMQFAGLMHDTAEAYFNDLASPIKRNPVMKGYVDSIGRLERLIFATYGIDWKLMALTKPADDAAFHLEVKSFWDQSYNAADKIIPFSDDRHGERLFLNRYKELRGHSLFEFPEYATHRAMEAV